MYKCVIIQLNEGTGKGGQDGRHDEANPGNLEEPPSASDPNQGSGASPD